MQGIETWCVTFDPEDYPDLFVGRKFINDRPTEEVCVRRSLEGIRRAIQGRSSLRLERLPRSPDDEPHIQEVWI